MRHGLGPASGRPPPARCPRSRAPSTRRASWDPGQPDARPRPAGAGCRAVAWSIDGQGVARARPARPSLYGESDRTWPATLEATLISIGLDRPRRGDDAPRAVLRSNRPMPARTARTEVARAL
ncbi:MAG: hypothetical protein MZV64_22880 [Ignavibacteriales bacterium]|nr:hypothetical protein [Ignavibacteriales bacterium]